jgi:hypothetical protein
MHARSQNKYTYTQAPPPSEDGPTLRQRQGFGFDDQLKHIKTAIQKHIKIIKIITKKL